MKRFLLGATLAVSGIVWLVVYAFVCPLAAVMRTDIRVQRSRELELDAIGYDDDDIGHDVDMCAPCAETAGGCVGRTPYRESLGPQAPAFPEPGIPDNVCSRCGFSAGPYWCSNCGAT